MSLQIHLSFCLLLVWSWMKFFSSEKNLSTTADPCLNSFSKVTALIFLDSLEPFVMTMRCDLRSSTCDSQYQRRFWRNSGFHFCLTVSLTAATKSSVLTAEERTCFLLSFLFPYFLSLATLILLASFLSLAFYVLCFFLGSIYLSIYLSFFLSFFILSFSLFFSLLFSFFSFFLSFFFSFNSFSVFLLIFLFLFIFFRSLWFVILSSFFPFFCFFLSSFILSFFFFLHFYTSSQNHLSIYLSNHTSCLPACLSIYL
ncbi:unnamed protein product [Acanthosepion pharaonis]|uniref:Uncharacterized protein n=1 Tax=Acanthosepion pharaonis TaxID=158019 RepID=A0A812CQB8_ACAPH|nr:unnamed protein product [Sepia pharaonis]